MEGGEEPGSMLDIDEPRPEARPEPTVVRVAPQVVAGVSSSLVVASEAGEEPVNVGRVKPPKRKRAPARCTVCGHFKWKNEDGDKSIWITLVASD